MLIWQNKSHLSLHDDFVPVYWKTHGGLLLYHFFGLRRIFSYIIFGTYYPSRITFFHKKGCTIGTLRQYGSTVMVYSIDHLLDRHHHYLSIYSTHLLTYLVIWLFINLSHEFINWFNHSFAHSLNYSQNRLNTDQVAWLPN